MINIKFKKVIIHHFLSFDHSELDLTDKGYCLISGVNRNPKDSAKSNGAGKSTIFNAVSYALVGETLQGLKSNLSNIHFNDGCYVQLDFSVDGHEYSLLRSKDDSTYGTNLKIILDGENKSGKGIRESQLILDQLLPDLTSELLGSVIMIGQGMPMKFTANTPSGRKEVLEHLSQSDFMIQDLKTRITNRSAKLNTDLRSVDDALLANKSQEEIYEKQLSTSESEYNEKYEMTPDFDSKLVRLNIQLDDETALNKSLEEQLTKLNSTVDELNSALIKVNSEKDEYAKKFYGEHTKVQEEYITKKAELSAAKESLRKEIEKLESIQDVCPTCGRPFEGVVKPDTSAKKAEQSRLNEELIKLAGLIDSDNADYNNIVNQLNEKYKSQLADLQSQRNIAKSDYDSVNDKFKLGNKKKQDILLEINNIQKDKEFFISNKNRMLNTIKELKDKLQELSNSKHDLDSQRADIASHIEVISKMNTIITRDFRGFLLKNIIEYINVKAKEYASKIFGCDEIEFILDGNNIDISFSGKDYENLSGGEKQRVDLIVQFAIRSFMAHYTQFSSNILVLDEITDALDTESCDKVISFITNELTDTESIFIISHHADELLIPIDSEVIVEKNIEGVSTIL